MINKENFPPLPDGIILKEYAEYLLVCGPDLDPQRYKEIKNSLPKHMQVRLMGWRKMRLLPGIS